jgi:flagellar biosynthesis component FlhA
MAEAGNGKAGNGKWGSGVISALVVVLALGALVVCTYRVLENFQTTTTCDKACEEAGGTTATDSSSVSASSVVAVLTPVIAGIVGIAGLFFGLSATGSAKAKQAEADQQVATTEAKTEQEVAAKKAETEQAVAAKKAETEQEVAKINAQTQIALSESVQALSNAQAPAGTQTEVPDPTPGKQPSGEEAT